MSLPWEYREHLLIVEDDDGQSIVEIDPDCEQPLSESQIAALGNWIATCGPAVLGLTMPLPDPHLTLIAELVSLLEGMERGDKGSVTDSEFDALRDRARQHLADHGLTPAPVKEQRPAVARTTVPVMQFLNDARKAALREIIDWTENEAAKPRDELNGQRRLGVLAVGAHCRTLLEAIP